MRCLFGRSRREAALREEIDQHLGMMIEENEAAGLSRDDARGAAFREFGGVEQIKEAHRDEWTFAGWEQLRKDFQFALRSLRKNPGFTVATVLILSLGIGANITVFGWMRQLLFDPIPGASDVADLVAVENFADAGDAAGPPLTTSYLDFADYRDHLRMLDVAAMGQGAFAVGGAKDTGRVWCELVSGNFFTLLGVRPAAGRFFSPAEQTDAQNAHPVAVISQDYCRTHFPNAASALEATLWINHEPFSIIGIAPPEFNGTQTPMAFQVWLPLSMYGQVTHTGTWMLRDRGTRNFRLLARLKAGATIAQARSETLALGQFMARRNGEDRGVGATVVPLWQWAFGPSELLLKPMSILMAGCGVLLLIVGANVVNLQLVRALGRQREFGVRLALGSSRWRLARLVLVESLTLALTGSALGLLIAFWLRGALAWLLPAVAMPAMVPAPFSPAVLGFAVLLAVVVAIAAGLTPAWHATRSNLNRTLKHGGRSGGSGASQGMRSVMVMAEMALAVVALAGAGIFLESFRAARAMPTGFSPEGQVLAEFNLATAAYNREQAEAFCQRLAEALEKNPGVTSVSYADTLPLGFRNGNWEEIQIEGYQARPGENMKIFRNLVGPGYFATMRIPFVDGRDFDLKDDARSGAVMIVSQEFVRRFLSQGIALGRRVHGWGRWFTIVGVVGDIKIHRVTENPIPFFYIPIRQEYRPEYGLTFHVRAEAPVDNVIATVRREAAAIDPAIVMFDAQSMSEYIAGSLYGERIAATMLGVLGGVGLLLAAVGLYSVMAYSVAQRTAEIGLRSALGARPVDLLLLVLRQGMRLAGIGLIAGSLIAVGLARLIAGMTETAHPLDPIALLATALLAALLALAAILVPAWRAIRVSPIVALRSE
jgi:predicted permease